MTLPSLDPRRRPRPRRHPAMDGGDLLSAADWAAMRRILVVRPDNLGDVVMTGPAMRALAAATPAAAIDLLCSPAGAAIAPLLPEVADLLVTSPVWQDAFPGGSSTPAERSRTAASRRASFEKLVEEVATRQYDAMVVLTSFSQSPLPPATVGLLAGVPVRAGLSRDFGGGVLTHAVAPPHGLLHQVDRQLHLLAAVGVPAQGRDLRLRLPDDAAARLADELARRGLTDDMPAGLSVAGAGTDPLSRGRGRPVVVVAPGASAPARRWDPERARRLVASLQERATVLVVGSSREQPLLEQVADGRAPVVAGLPIAAWAALLARADVAVVNNSGGLHVADALGTPVVVTWGGTEPLEHMRPRGVAAQLLRRDTSCSPCHQFRCPYGDTACLDLSAEEVERCVLALLDGSRSEASVGGSGVGRSEVEGPTRPSARDQRKDPAWTV